MKMEFIYSFPPNPTQLRNWIDISVHIYIYVDIRHIKISLDITSYFHLFLSQFLTKSLPFLPSNRNDINVDPFIDLSPMKGMGYSNFMPFSNIMSPPRAVYMPSFLDKQPPPLPPSNTSYHGYVYFFYESLFSAYPFQLRTGVVIEFLFIQFLFIYFYYIYIFFRVLGIECVKHCRVLLVRILIP